MNPESALYLRTVPTACCYLVLHMPLPPSQPLETVSLFQPLLSSLWHHMMQTSMLLMIRLVSLQITVCFRYHLLLSRVRYFAFFMEGKAHKPFKMIIIVFFKMVILYWEAQCTSGKLWLLSPDWLRVVLRNAWLNYVNIMFLGLSNELSENMSTNYFIWHACTYHSWRYSKK